MIHPTQGRRARHPSLVNLDSLHLHAGVRTKQLAQNRPFTGGRLEDPEAVLEIKGLEYRLRAPRRGCVEIIRVTDMTRLRGHRTA